MHDAFRARSPLDVGCEFLSQSLGPIGGTGLLGATPFTSAGVTNVPIEFGTTMVRAKRARLVFGGTVPAGTNTCTARIRKRLADGSFQNITEAVTMFGRTTGDVVTLTLASGVRGPDLQLNAGEYYVLTVDNTGGTITTQPTLFYATLVVGLLR